MFWEQGIAHLTDPSRCNSIIGKSATFLWVKPSVVIWEGLAGHSVNLFFSPQPHIQVESLATFGSASWSLRANCELAQLPTGYWIKRLLLVAA